MKIIKIMVVAAFCAGILNVANAAAQVDCCQPTPFGIAVGTDCSKLPVCK